MTEPSPTRDHTERLLRAMGADLRFGEGPVVRVRPLNGELRALSLRVPVALLDGRPSTPFQWAAMLCERLSLVGG